MDNCKAYISPFFILSACLAFLSPLVAADEKKALFQELKGLKVPDLKLGEGSVVRPTQIVKRKDLKELLGKGKKMLQLRKTIDFEKQKVLVFRWSGSGQDSLTVKAEPNEKKPDQPHFVFHYKRGLTKDLRPHAKVYLLPAKSMWKVLQGKPGAPLVAVRAKPVPAKPAPPKVQVAPKVQIIPNIKIQQRIVPAPPIVRDGKAGVIRGGLKAAIPRNPGLRSMRVYQQWTGFMPNGAPSIPLPKKGYVNDEESWLELWHAWRPTEKVPEVDFQNEIVFVGALQDKLRVYVRAMKTEAGEATISVNGSGTTKGLSYSFAKVMRAGLISINGQRLPGAPD